jgi:methylamine dehydrogenase accessory protein MauD
VEGVWLVAYVIMWVFLIFLGVLVFVLFHELGRTHLGTSGATLRDGLRAAAKAPPFAALGESGKTVNFDPVGDKATFLIFGTPDCRVCQDLVPALEEFVAHRSSVLRAVLVFRTASEDPTATIDRYGSATTTLAVGSSDVVSRYKVRVTPFGYLIDQAGIIRAKGLVNGHNHLHALWQMANMETPPYDASEKLVEGHVNVKP